MQLWKPLLLCTWKGGVKDFDAANATYSTRSIDLWSSENATHREKPLDNAFKLTSVASLLQLKRFGNVSLRRVCLSNGPSANQLPDAPIVLKLFLTDLKPGRVLVTLFLGAALATILCTKHAAKTHLGPVLDLSYINSHLYSGISAQFQHAVKRSAITSGYQSTVTLLRDYAIYLIRKVVGGEKYGNMAELKFRKRIQNGENLTQRT